MNANHTEKIRLECVMYDILVKKIILPVHCAVEVRHSMGTQRIDLIHYTKLSEQQKICTNCIVRLLSFIVDSTSTYTQLNVSTGLGLISR